MNIAIFGGTFNPLHAAHVSIVQQFIQEFAPALVYVIPCALSPFKQKDLYVADHHRLAMLQLAFSDPHIIVDDRELRRGGISYTIDTLRELRQEHPNHPLYLIIGGDQALHFSQWKDYMMIAQLCTILVAERPHYGGKEHIINILGPHTHVKALPIELSSISSTDIRQDIWHGNDISADIPAAVYSYIKKHNLYSTAALPSRERPHDNP